MMSFEDVVAVLKLIIPLGIIAGIGIIINGKR